jgi:hypothetical protein
VEFAGCFGAFASAILTTFCTIQVYFAKAEHGGDYGCVNMSIHVPASWTWRKVKSKQTDAKQEVINTKFYVGTEVRALSRR